MAKFILKCEVADPKKINNATEKNVKLTACDLDLNDEVKIDLTRKEKPCFARRSGLSDDFDKESSSEGLKQTVSY